MSLPSVLPRDWAAASLTDVAGTGSARRGIVPAAAVAATALLLLAGANLGRFPLLAAAVAMAPAGLTSPLAGIVAAMAGPMLLTARVLAAFCACFGLLRIVARLAGSDLGGMTATAALIGLSWIVAGPGLISGGPAIGGAFSPTQAAAALLILALALALDGLPVAAIALLGAVFAIQPEVALWGVFILAAASIGLARQGTRVSRAWLAGGACALLLAAPAALWWTHATGFVPAHAPTDGMLPPPAWQPWFLPLASWILSASMLAMGLAACSALGPDGWPMLGAFAAGVLVFVCGCVLPLVTRSPWLLALRPMTIDAVLQPLATVAAAAVLARDLAGRSGTLRLALSTIAAAGLLLHPFLLPLAALAMLARAAAAHGELLGIERRIRDWDRALLSRAALGAVALAAVAGGVLRTW